MKISCYDIESNAKNVWKYIRLILALCLVIYLRIKYYHKHVIVLREVGTVIVSTIFIVHKRAKQSSMEFEDSWF